jgi:hypothetical protein
LLGYLILLSGAVRKDVLVQSLGQSLKSRPAHFGGMSVKAAGNFSYSRWMVEFSAAAVALALLFPFHLQKSCHMVRLCLTKRIIFWNDCPASVALPASSPCFSLFNKKVPFFLFSRYIRSERG